MADSIYWMSRYIERAENVARFVDVNLALMLDSVQDMTDKWVPLVHVTGDYPLFEERHEAPTRDGVIQFLTFDLTYPNSILSCLEKARENARTVRDTISSEMWENLNTLYLTLKDASRSSRLADDLHGFFTSIKKGSHLFTGVTDATMSHGEAWHFARLGRLLERADKTSRIIEVKYFMLLPRVADVGTPIDNIQWAALLKSASAFEMYRKKCGRIHPMRVVEFLILDLQFPRSIHYCLIKAEESLYAITGTPRDTFSNPAEQYLGRLRSDLDYATIEEITHLGLHEYLEDFQSNLNTVGQKIFETFFAIYPSIPWAGTHAPS